MKLSPAQKRVLAELANGPTRAHVVGRGQPLKCNRTTAVRLRDAGYVETTGELYSWKPGGAESFTIAITDAGRKALEDAK